MKTRTEKFSDILDTGEREFQILTPVGVWVEFVNESTIWKDFISQCEADLMDIRDALEDLPHFEDPTNTPPLSKEMQARLKGAAAAIRRVMQIPAVIAMRAQMDRENSEAERDVD